MKKIEAAKITLFANFGFSEEYIEFIQSQTNVQVLFDILRSAFEGKMPTDVNAFK